MDEWVLDYSDNLSEGPRTLERLFRQDDEKVTFDALKLILDKAPQFLQDYYKLIPDYQDGLNFVSFAYDILKKNGKGAPIERIMRWDICLISLKLEMLDKLGRWKEYKEYFDTMYRLHPNYQGAYEKTAFHLKIDRASPYLLDEDEDFLYVHFLYLLLPRYEAINKFLKYKKIPITRKQPKLNSEKAAKDYMAMSERLHGLIALDSNLMRKFR